MMLKIPKAAATATAPPRSDPFRSMTLKILRKGTVKITNSITDSGLMHNIGSSHSQKTLVIDAPWLMYLLDSPWLSWILFGYPAFFLIPLTLFNSHWLSSLSLTLTVDCRPFSSTSPSLPSSSSSSFFFLCFFFFPASYFVFLWFLFFLVHFLPHPSSSSSPSPSP